MSSDTLVAASAKPMVLTLLLSGESYGYEILQRVRRVSDGELEWSSAMLYPVLRRMEKEGLIRSDWRVSEENRMRRYYRLTDRGREEFEREKARWLSVQKALVKVWAASAVAEGSRG